MKKALIFAAALLLCVAGAPHSQPGTPLGSALAPAVAQAAQRQEVTAQWTSDAPASPRDVFVADKEEQHTSVLLSSPKGVKNFKVLKLFLKQIDNDGKPEFLVKELHSQPVLAPGRPLEVVLTFFGTIPAYGISYVDSTGKTRYFSLDMSGKDGSVLLTEF